MSGATGDGARAARRRTGWSLRLRLTLVTAGLLCVALVVGAFVLSTVVSRSRVAALDDVVRSRALTVAGLVVSDQVPDALPVTEPGEIVQVLDAEGRVVASSPTASRTLPVLPAAVVVDLAAQAGGPEPLLLTTTDSAYDPAARAAVLVPPGGGGAAVVATAPLAEVDGLVRALRLSLLGVVPVLTALLAAAIWLALSRALRPVERLRAGAAEVARAGGPGSLPDPGTADEVGALARTLNAMLDRLEEAAGRQRAFVADAAHELRTPVAALAATLDVAAAHPDAYEPAELVADLGAEVRRLGRLVDDLLLLARVGSRPVPAAGVDLRAITDGAVDVARRSVAGGGVRVPVEVRGTGATTGDGAALGRVVRNLVENAVRHARTGVVVTVGDGRVEVRDDGPGVPTAERERVFERFVRLDDARDRPGPGPGPGAGDGGDGGGSGLGLAIAREIAREHGGDVLLEDAAPGLRAVLRLPR